MSIFLANRDQKPSKRDQVPAKKMKKSQKTRKNPFRRVYVCVLDHTATALALAPGPIRVAKKAKNGKNGTGYEKAVFTKVSNGRGLGTGDWGLGRQEETEAGQGQRRRHTSPAGLPAAPFPSAEMTMGMAFPQQAARIHPLWRQGNRRPWVLRNR